MSELTDRLATIDPNDPFNEATFAPSDAEIEVVKRAIESLESRISRDLAGVSEAEKAVEVWTKQRDELNLRISMASQRRDAFKKLLRRLEDNEFG